MLNDDLGVIQGRPRSLSALGATPVTIHLTLADVDALWGRAVAAGAKVVMPLADQFWGSRYGILEDPFGHHWSLGTPQKPVSAEEMRSALEKSFGSQA